MENSKEQTQITVTLHPALVQYVQLFTGTSACGRSTSLKREKILAVNWQDNSYSGQYSFKKETSTGPYRYCMAVIFNLHFELLLKGCERQQRKVCIYIVQQCVHKTPKRIQFQWKIVRGSTN